MASVVRSVDLDDLVDAHVVAEMLRLSRRTAVSTYRARYPDFPDPVVDMGSGRCLLWLRADILDWASRAREEPPQARSVADLRAAFEHIDYEVRCMVSYALRYRAARRSASAADVTAEGAFFDSALLHARCIIEFLLGDKETDIRPSDFGTGWRIDKGGADDLRARKRALDRHLAHLSWQRVDDPTMWEYSDLARVVLEIFRQLAATDDRFAGTIRAADETVRQERGRGQRDPLERALEVYPG